jgi:hypothetical protein
MVRVGVLVGVLEPEPEHPANTKPASAMNSCVRMGTLRGSPIAVSNRYAANDPITLVVQVLHITVGTNRPHQNVGTKA